MKLNPSGSFLLCIKLYILFLKTYFDQTFTTKSKNYQKSRHVLKKRGGGVNDYWKVYILLNLPNPIFLLLKNYIYKYIIILVYTLALLNTQVHGLMSSK